MPVGSVDELNNIIINRSLYPVFQPIYNINIPCIIGYEALIRGPANTNLHSPVTLFETANQNGLIPDLEYACRDISCEQFIRHNLAGKLFLNISPMSLVQKPHQNGNTNRILRKHDMAAEKVVIELSEQYPLEDYDVVRMSTHHYREMGFEIAIDDLGVGYSGLRVWSEIRPEFVKIDRHFIENIDTDPIKREFVRSIQEISRSLGCKVIAEGLETMEELAVIRSIGIQYAQGYLLGRPQTIPNKVIPAYLREPGYALRYKQGLSRTKTVADLVEHSTSLSPEVTLEYTADLFHSNMNMMSMPIVEDGIPIGIVMRRSVLELFLGRYGRELYARKPIREFMYKKPIIVEHDRSLEELSRLITDDPNLDLSMEFIIVIDGKYLGAGRVRKLLEEITEQQIRSARYSNPLTTLPGNVPIYEWIDELLEKREDFYIAYCDINHFKPYNDKYGYSKGDEVIMKLGEILQRHADMDTDLVGHIGGDDFIVIFRSDDWHVRCKNIVQDFNGAIRDFYNEEDLFQRGIKSIDRRGDKQFFPLLSLAIGVANPDNTRCLSHHDVSALASDAKHSAKSGDGNTIFVSRRRGADDITAINDNLNPVVSISIA